MAAAQILHIQQLEVLSHTVRRAPLPTSCSEDSNAPLTEIGRSSREQVTVSHEIHQKRSYHEPVLRYLCDSCVEEGRERGRREEGRALFLKLL